MTKRSEAGISIEKRAIQLTDLFSFKLAGDVQVRPDAKQAAFVIKVAQTESNDYRTEIHVVDLPVGRVRQFTHHVSDNTPRYSPDGQNLAFLSRRSGSVQVWCMAVSGGEAYQITDLPSGVQEFSWSPDGKRLALVAKAGPKATAKADEGNLLAKHTAGVTTVTDLLYKMDGVGYFGAERPCLFVVAAEPSGAVVQLTEPPYLVSAPVWLPDGTAVLVKGRMDPTDFDRGGSEQQVWAIPSAGGRARQVSPTGLSVREVAVAPDGKRVATVASWTAGMSYDNATLFLLDFNPSSTAPSEALKWQSDFDHPLDDSGVSDFSGVPTGPLRWSEDGTSLLTLASVRGATHLVSVKPESGTAQLLTNADQHIYSYAFGGDGTLALYVANEPERPSILKLVTSSGETELLDPNADLLAGLEVSRPERFTVQGEDGPPVDAWIVKPIGFREGTTYPAVVNIHGGPALMYTSGFFFEFQLLAALGYAVVYGNPRGSHGYGEEFCQAIKYEWGGVDYDDVMAITDDAVKNYKWINPTRLGVAGGSYGGYMTNWIVGHTDRFAAAVTGRSISDWRSAIGSGDLGTFRFKRVDGVPFWEDNTWYEQQSPITYVGNVRTPILIEHQQDDHRCTIDQAFAWYSAIKYLDQAPTRMVIYPDEGHGMSRTGKPWHRVHRLKEISAWFEQYLGGSPAASSGYKPDMQASQ